MKTEETTYREGAELEQRICNTYVDKFNGCGEIGRASCRERV